MDEDDAAADADEAEDADAADDALAEEAAAAEDAEPGRRLVRGFPGRETLGIDVGRPDIDGTESDRTESDGIDTAIYGRAIDGNVTFGRFVTPPKTELKGKLDRLREGIPDTGRETVVGIDRERPGTMFVTPPSTELKGSPVRSPETPGKDRLGRPLMAELKS